MELAEAMTTQRAVRRVKPDPVDDELIKKILGLAIKAPSGSNQQGWEWIVVRDPKVKHGLAKQYRTAFGLYGRVGRRVKRDEPKMLRVLDAVQWQVDNFEKIPVMIVACLNQAWIPKAPWIYRSSRYGSIYPAVQNLLLAARAEGLGAALTTLPLWNRVSARRILGLPPGVEPIAVIPLGWPIGRYGPTTRRPVEEVTSIDRYGNRAWRGNA
ncbi:MAG: nitroreductase family protein [Actinomycetota bacterium]